MVTLQVLHFLSVLWITSREEMMPPSPTHIIVNEKQVKEKWGGTYFYW